MKKIRLLVVLLPALLAAAPTVVRPPGTPVPECGLMYMPIRETDARAARPTLSGPAALRTKAHVKVHYTTSGSDATTLAYAESTAVFAESCWVRNERMDWQTPPPDFNGGGDNMFDIYLRSTDNIGAYGVSCYDTVNPVYYNDGWCSWIEITKDSVPHPFTRFGRLKALVSHEFHHSVQMAYSRTENPLWAFYENTTVWFEDVCWPGHGTLYWRNNNTGSYTVNPLTYTYMPVNEDGSNYWYPGGLWALFLTEYYGSSTMRNIWRVMGNHTGSHCLYDIDSVLRRDHDSNLQNALGHYAMWRYFTGGRDDGLHFGRAEDCTTSFRLRTHSTYPANGDEGTWDPIGPGGMDMIEFTTTTDRNLTITFNGQNGYTWRAYVLATRNNLTHEQRITLDGNGDGSITIPAAMWTRAVLIPVVVQWSDASLNTPALTFSYGASASFAPLGIEDATVPDDQLRVLSANPTRGPLALSCRIPAGTRARLTIVDAAGRPVCRRELSGGPQRVEWNLTDGQGSRVARGIYFCELQSGGETARRKLIVE